MGIGSYTPWEVLIAMGQGDVDGPKLCDWLEPHSGFLEILLVSSYFHVVVAVIEAIYSFYFHFCY